MRKEQLKCFNEIIIFNPYQKDLHGMQALIRNTFDAFVIEVKREDIDSFHNINCGRNRLFVYVADNRKPDYPNFDIADSTRCIPNVGTWFTEVGLPEWDPSNAKTADFYDMGKSDFDPIVMIRTEDAKAAVSPANVLPRDLFV